MDNDYPLLPFDFSKVKGYILPIHAPADRKVRWGFALFGDKIGGNGDYFTYRWREFER